MGKRAALVGAPRSNSVRCLGCHTGQDAARNRTKSSSQMRPTCARSRHLDIFSRWDSRQLRFGLMNGLVGPLSGTTREGADRHVAEFRGSYERSRVTADTPRRHQSPGSDLSEVPRPPMERPGSCGNPYVRSDGVLTGCAPSLRAQPTSGVPTFQELNLDTNVADVHWRVKLSEHAFRSSSSRPLGLIEL